MHGSHFVSLTFYSPTPSVAWSKISGDLPYDRIVFTNYNTALTITNVETSDAGQYNCTGTNAQGSSSFVVELEVDGKMNIIFTFELISAQKFLEILGRRRANVNIR